MKRWVNRAAVIVRPAKPYLDWASRLDEGEDDDLPEQLKVLEKRVSVYLVAEDPNEEEESAPLANYFKTIFENELEAWWTDEADWPKNRTLELFLQWFNVERQSVVTDLESGPISREKI
jgi:hypothetical protein